MKNTIIQDTRENAEYRDSRVDYFITQGYKVELKKLDIGDYAIKGKPDRVVDFKMNIQEMIGNIQDSTISKSKIKRNVARMCENYGVPEEKASMIYDTIIADDLVVDVEPMLQELCEDAGFEPMQCLHIRNLYRAHRTRLHRLLVKAKRRGVKLYFLIANTDRVKDLESLKEWKNPRLRISPKAMTGERLAKAMQTISERYGAEFIFTTPEEQGEMILKILEGEDD